MTSTVVLAPVAGRALRLGDVPDPVYAAALVGTGVAVDPSRGPVVATAPLSGTVAQLHPHLY
ncbi:MAG: PTS glucose transporter subunit IIA, partial [Actinomycetota bacterium]